MRDKTPGATYILIEGNDLFLIKNIAKVTTDPRVAFAKRTAFKVMSQFSQNSASESRAEPQILTKLPAQNVDQCYVALCDGELF